MNSRQLKKLGIPEDPDCIAAALRGIQSASKAGMLRNLELRQIFASILSSPAEHFSDPHFGELACVLTALAEPIEPVQPIEYRTWGSEIDAGAHQQMALACQMPNAIGAALMPDAHVGYGLPIGGVLALRDAVCPFAVGVDIACRMKLSVFDVPTEQLGASWHFEKFRNALEQGTLFGVGARYKKPMQHAVMDEDWTVSRVTRENKDKAWQQLGTSGSGNHFAEFGTLTLSQDAPDLGLTAGTYVALLTHSGSRGVGAAVCSTYSAIARANLPRRFEFLGRLAWLDMQSSAGQEYWAAMNLMGQYAAANHAVIHRQVTHLLGAEVIAGVENHHNFAWKERHGDEDLYVHRKGATPAGPGVLGVIPGSMADPGYVVRGKGDATSLHSAAHGAGRRMSRTAARQQYNFRAVQKDLEKRGITILSAGADEVPGVYKNIDSVMAEQTDLVEVVARFDPKIVKMCGDGSAAED
ncbi:MAG: RtcB family protein [Planctomycetota bacterium]|nr:RtcB family protein [Planctomycetota bacterium]